MIFPGYGFGAEVVRSYNLAESELSSAIEEGLALTFKYPLEGGLAKVKKGSTASTDVFAGISYYQHRVLPTKLNKVDAGTVPASGPYTFTLSKTPVAPGSEMRVVVTTALGVSTVLTYHADTVNATQFTVSGNIVTVDGTHSGKSIQVVYSYTPSAFEARDFFGDIRPGLNNTSSLGVINVITRGIIVTTNYDPTSDWSDSNAIKIATTGYLTKSGSGTSIPNALVREIPTVSKPFLTIELRS
jgi:hypothetical protein